MANTTRVDKSLFESEHYLGKPADFSDLLVQRRLNVLRNHKGFLDKNANIVEIGCGNGNTIIPLAGEFCRAIGLEYANVHSADFFQLKQDQNAENAHFVVWDIMTKPYEPLADRLISFEVIEHLPSEDGVANYVKSLKIGGIAAISVPNKWWIFETHGAKLPYLPWNRVPFFGWLPRPLHERWAHARIYTKRRICKLLEKHDFEIIETHLITAPMDVIRWKPFQKFLRRWIFFGDTTSIPFKAVSILVICRRKK
ncbi:MAG: methyltransferase domain-containing protein [Bacteroidetes bacterium]|nr:methyltransferase domain-containing protein [Bacteroidota bacterium]